MAKLEYWTWVLLLFIFALLSAVYLTNLSRISIASIGGFAFALGCAAGTFGLPALISLSWFALRHKFDYSKARGSLILWSVGSTSIGSSSFWSSAFAPIFA